MLSLSDNNQIDIIESFNSTSRYLDDLLNIDKKVSEYDQEIPQSHTADQRMAP